MRFITITLSILVFIVGLSTSVYYINPYDVTSTSISERFFGVHLYKIPSKSMQPTLVPGDYILVSTLAYSHQPLIKKDVIIFTRANNLDENGKTIPYVKRVLAVENDSIKIENGNVIINNIVFKESYVKKANQVTPYSLNMKEITVPAGKVFVLGDNRDKSSDSRKFGFIEVAHIIGKATYLLYGKYGRTGNEIKCKEYL